MPPHIIQSYQDTLTEEEMDGNAGRSISNFNIHTNEDGSVTYVLWTESAPMLKDGVDPHSEEAKLEENQSTQIQIYGSRLKDGRWSGRTQITEAEAVYGNLDFTVNEAGNLVILASKNEVEEEAAGLERNGCDLVNILAAPDEKIALDKLTLSEVMEGENGGSVIVKNEGFVDAKNVQLVIKDQDGEEILTKQFDTLYSGQSEECYFSLNLPEGTANWKVTAELKSGGITEDKIEREGEIPLNVTLDTLTLTQEESRDMVTAELRVTNASAITVKEQNAVISEEAGGAALASVKIPKLAPGESTIVTAEVPIRDDMFAVYTDSEAGEQSEEGTSGDAVEKLTLYAVADYTGTVSGSIERRTSAKDLEYIQSITDIILQNGEKVKVNAGEYQAVKVDIQSPLMKYDEFTTYRNYNLEVLWRTEDSDIVQVDENGILKGIKEGKTTLTAIVKPRGNEVWLEEGVNGKELDNTLSLTSDAFKIAAVEVEVLQGTQENGGTTPSDNAGAEKQPGNETTGSKQTESEATANVKTGDTAQPFLWLIMIVASGCLILVVSRKRKMR